MSALRAKAILILNKLIQYMFGVKMFSIVKNSLDVKSTDQIVF